MPEVLPLQRVYMMLAICNDDSSDYSRNSDEAADEKGSIRFLYVDNGGHDGR